MNTDLFRNLFSSRLLLLMGLIFSPGAAQLSAAHEYTLYQHYERTATEAFLNGFPLPLSLGTNTVTHTISAHRYLIVGTNKLVIKTTGIPPKAEELTPHRVRMRLTTGDGTNETEHFVILREVVHQTSEGPRETVSLESLSGFGFIARSFLTNQASSYHIEIPARKSLFQSHPSTTTNTVEILFHLTNTVLTTLPWQTPRGGPLTEADYSSIRTNLQNISAAISARDIPQLLQAFRVKNQRAALFNQTTLAEEEAETRSTFEDLFNDTTFSFQPFDGSAIQFKSFEPSNLVQIFVNGQAPIRGSNPAFSYKLDIYMSKIDGTWVIVE